MDVKEVRAILSEFDAIGYHRAVLQKDITDEVWPIGVEDAFLSVGQRKYHIEERKGNGVCTELVGRNDIISRYIFMKTNKFRARKQVSSHIQVWVHCKKPPSNHSMDMETFQDIQTVFRLHYSRPNTGFGNLKKTRRAVSSSNIRPNVDKSIPSYDSLGIYQDSSDMSSAKDPSAMRKHSMPSSLPNPAKRFRRVVSELPRSSLGLLLTPNAIESPTLMNDSENANSDEYSQIALLGCHNEKPVFDSLHSVFGDALMSQSASFASQESMIQQPSMMVPPCELPFSQLSSETYDIAPEAAEDSADSTAAVFMMATIAAIGGYEGLADGNTSHSTEQAACADLLATTGFKAGSQINPLSLSSEHATPAPTGTVSAFSTASGASSCFPNELVHNNLGHSYISTADSIAATAPMKQAAITDIPTNCNTDLLAEALSWYYAENGFDSIMSMHTPQYTQEATCMPGVTGNWFQDLPAFNGINREMADLDLTKISPSAEDVNATVSLKSHELESKNEAASLADGPCDTQTNEVAMPAQSQNDICAGGAANVPILSQQPKRGADAFRKENPRPRPRNKTVSRGQCGIASKSMAKDSACTPSKRSSSKESDMTVVACGSSCLNDSSSPILAAKDGHSTGLPTSESTDLGEAAGCIDSAEGALVVDWVSKLVGLSHAYSCPDISSRREHENPEVSSLPQSSGNCDWYSMFEHYLPW
ncbi:hypothetical protein EV178_004244 [Coemansia sp. RSA 1646]|nr:hypothetical protein EV178_004244 [Coemansia sp. RSA 1646]